MSWWSKIWWKRKPMPSSTEMNTWESSLTGFASGAKCHTQTWRLEVREKEDQDKSEDGGSLQVIHRLFLWPANTCPKWFVFLWPANTCPKWFVEANKKFVWGSTKIAPKCLVFHIFIKCGRLWIWYTFLRMHGGTHNDINMLQRVPMFVKLAEHHAPKRTDEITSHQYTKWWNGTT
jgi:hypothetical protein